MELSLSIDPELTIKKNLPLEQTQPIAAEVIKQIEPANISSPGDVPQGGLVPFENDKTQGVRVQTTTLGQKYFLKVVDNILLLKCYEDMGG